MSIDQMHADRDDGLLVYTYYRHYPMRIGSGHGDEPVSDLDTLFEHVAGTPSLNARPAGAADRRHSEAKS